MKYVIIGNSIAAIGAIEGIRKVDKLGEITVISKEKHHVYSRPLISYLLLGKTDHQKMKYRSDNFYLENQVKVLYEKEAVRIDQKKVILDDKQIIPFDKLLIATGSNPFIPPIEGLDNVTNKTTFMSLDDAIQLQKMLNPNAEVLIIGAGLIGLKCAEGIYKSVKEIQIVDLAKYILPSILDETSSQIIKTHLENQQMKFYLDDSILKLTKDECFLKSGKTIKFDVLVIAVGVRPNIELFKALNGNINRGIIIDEFGKTSIADIYAAGDCAEGYDLTIKQNRMLPLLPNAYMQGENAGINMALGDSSFKKGIPMNSIGFLGLHLITAGIYEGEKIVISDINNYKALFVKDNLLKGYIIIGDVKRAGIYTSLIRNEVKLDTIDFEIIKNKPELMAFNQETRNALINKLEG